MLHISMISLLPSSLSSSSEIARFAKKKVLSEISEFTVFKHAIGAVKCFADKIQM